MNLLLVDDEPLVLSLLNRRVAAVLPDAERFSFSSASAAMECAEKTPIDVAFLDINMRMMDGVTMAKKLMALYPRINIIFCTGYSEYMADALNMYCSGYLLKPITEQAMREAVEHLRYPVEGKSCPVVFRCFGNFEAFFEGTPMHFKYSRTKELLAYLVDRNGADCTIGELSAVMFEDDCHASYLRTLKKDLTDVFTELGQGDVIRSGKGTLGVQRELVSCDYFDFLDGKTTTPPAEYMTQFSFGESTFAALQGYGKK